MQIKIKGLTGNITILEVSYQKRLVEPDQRSIEVLLDEIADIDDQLISVDHALIRLKVVIAI